MAIQRWPTTHDSLLNRLRDPADRQSWSEITSIYGPLVFRYCRSRGLQPVDCEDIEQEVLAKLVEFEYQPTRGRFRSWLKHVTDNQINQLWRKRKRIPVPSANPADNELAGEPLDWDRLFHVHILDAALRRIRPEFDERSWQAFEQVALAIEDDNGIQRFAWRENGSSSAVAKRLDRPVTWVYKVKCRIMSRLRNEILNLAEEFGVID